MPTAAASLPLMGRQFLAACYAYYVLHVSVMPDEQFDRLAKELLERYDEWDAPEKAFVGRADLAAGTLYGLAAEGYPVRAREAGRYWASQVKISGKN